jgi:tRNA (cmo5U34)-methyltransferase
MTGDDVAARGGAVGSRDFRCPAKPAVYPADGPGSAWKREDLAIGFVEDRRNLIPMFAEQEELTRLLITRGGRRITRFCDLGAGDGGLADLVMEAYPDSTCVLVDFSEPMVAAAKSRLADRKGRWEQVEADLATPAWLDALPRTGRFDAVISRLCIHHLPDTRKRELYQEVFDLLEPGGLFLNWDHVAIGGLAEGMFDDYFIEQMIAAEKQSDHPRSEAELRALYMDSHEEDILLDPETQCDWLHDIGFEQTEVYFKAIELAIFAGVKPREGS